MLRVRLYVSTDRAFVLSLVPRLAIGMQPWRDLELWLTTVEGTRFTRVPLNFTVGRVAHNG